MTSYHLKKQNSELLPPVPKEPISCLTHFFGFVCALIMTPPAIVKAHDLGSSSLTVVGITIFMLSMCVLYLASATYHAFNTNSRTKLNLMLKRIDHMSIFILIAGSYTPVCLSVLGGTSGRILLIVIWSIALAGMLFKFCWVTCPKWVSSLLYIGMGWACIGVLPQLVTVLSPFEFGWLLAGGLMYTAGGIIYALKLKLIPPNRIGFGNHELFHLFVLAGSLCHFIMMYGSICLR